MVYTFNTFAMTTVRWILLAVSSSRDVLQTARQYQND